MMWTGFVSRKGALLGAVILGLSSGCHDDGGSIVISEFVAANANGLKDSDGQTSDWIEIGNMGTAVVNLKNWRLTDDPAEPMRWVFPEVSISPGQYVVVFASGKGQSPGASELHTSFRMKATPDFLALLRPNGRAVTQFKPYPEQRNDVSYGVGSDGVTGYLESPTPGAPNSPSLAKKKDKDSKADKNTNN
jgi:Lamin Tail Domain